MQRFGTIARALSTAWALASASACTQQPEPARIDVGAHALDVLCTELGHTLVDHACFHAVFGPFVNVTASATPAYAAASPNVNAVHTHYTIALPAGSPGAHEGTIKYRPLRGGDWAIFTNPGTAMEVLDPSDAPRPVLLEHAVPGCAQLPLVRVYELTANVTYRLRFTASATASVATVFEKLSDFENAYFADVDGDGFGDANVLYPTACTAPEGHVSDDTDCDDGSATTYPSATELCDELDNDCDGLVDEGAGVTSYRDVDGDGHGAAAVTAFSCTAPAGYVALGDDCDDAAALANPSATEICDGIDNDCDGAVDEAVTNACGGCGAMPVEICDGADNDCDGVIDEGVTNACGGCGAVGSETCDNVDNDCDDAVDEGAALITYYADADGDGYGDAASSVQACVEPAGYVTDSTDCNDEDAQANPEAEEVCDGADDDCNGGVDDVEDPLEHVAEHACEHAQLGPFSTIAAAPVGTGGPDVSGRHRAYTIELPPEAPPAYAGEVALSVLNAGDYAILLGTETSLQVVHESGAVVDAEHDQGSDVCPELAHIRVYDLEPGDYRLLLGPGSESLTLMVIEPAYHEDEGAEHEEGRHFFLDADGDGFGNAAVETFACAAPAGYVSDDTDCNDERADVRPGAEEICDEADNDCDAEIDTAEGMSVCDCEPFVLEASKAYYPSCRNDGEIFFDHSAELTIPSEISVVQGNAGNHAAYLYFVDLSAVTKRRPIPPVVKCTYRGGSSQTHPVGATQIARGQRWLFQGCTRRFDAGDSIDTDYARLTVNGSSRHGVTRGRVELEDMSCE